jgi:hypothetical protein
MKAIIVFAIPFALASSESIYHCTPTKPTNSLSTEDCSIAIQAIISDVSSGKAEYGFEEKFHSYGICSASVALDTPINATTLEAEFKQLMDACPYGSSHNIETNATISLAAAKNVTISSQKELKKRHTQALSKRGTLTKLFFSEDGIASWVMQLVSCTPQLEHPLFTNGVAVGTLSPILFVLKALSQSHDTTTSLAEQGVQQVFQNVVYEINYSVTVALGQVSFNTLLNDLEYRTDLDDDFASNLAQQALIFAAETLLASTGQRAGIFELRDIDTKALLMSLTVVVTSLGPLV